MRRGEAAVLAIVVLVAGGAMMRSALTPEPEHSRDIPYYSTAAPALAAQASDLMRREGCRHCHSLWTLRDMMQAVPSPMLDGMGSLRDESWLFDYLSASDPQSILPSRLKKEYRMPSYAGLPEAERRTLAAYLASLRVRDWYLAETRRMEQEKLTGVSPPETAPAAK